MFLGGSLGRFSRCRCLNHNHFYRRRWCRCCRCRWISSNLSPEPLNYCVGDLDHSCGLIIDDSDLPGTLVGTHLDHESSLSLFTNLTSTLISCRSESSNK